MSGRRNGTTLRPLFFFAPERPAALDQKRVRISSPTLRALRGSLRRPVFRPALPPSLCSFCGIYTTSSRPQLLSGNHIFYRRFAYCASCREPLGTHRFQRAVVGKCLLVRIRRPPKSPCLCRVFHLRSCASGPKRAVGLQWVFHSRLHAGSDAYPGACGSCRRHDTALTI